MICRMSCLDIVNNERISDSELGDTQDLLLTANREKRSPSFYPASYKPQSGASGDLQCPGQ